MGDDEEHLDALSPEEITITLDPARAVMYRLAVQAAGDEEVVQEFIQNSAQQATEQLYESRDDLAAQREAMEAEESEGTDIVADATGEN